MKQRLFHTLSGSLALATLLGVSACGPKPNPNPPTPKNNGITLSSTVPGDLPDTTATPSDLGKFAWAEFVALNWLAESGQRDVASKMTFAEMGDKPYPTVWMTYAHRVEYRPNVDALGPLSNTPSYTYREMPMKGNSADDNTMSLWNNLDEDNEIGSCLLFNMTQEEEILYQAKVNTEMYDYTRQVFGTQTAMRSAQSTTETNIGNNEYWPGQGKTTPCFANVPDSDSNSTFCFPCGNNEGQVGAMEIKTAWRRVTEAERKDENFMNSIITAPAIYYTNHADPNADPNDTITEKVPTYYQQDTFALVGIHIIHKTENFPAFVFATFEHNSLRAGTDGDYRYFPLSKLDPHFTQEGIPVDANTIEPVYSDVDAMYYEAIKAQNPNSVLLNYRLTGVQGVPTSNTDSTSYNLANFAIESDTHLAQFPQSGDAATGKQPNTLWYGSKRQMGGCQGCHGFQAQLDGTDFSFVSQVLNNPGFGKPDIMQTLAQARAESREKRGTN